MRIKRLGPLFAVSALLFIAPIQAQQSPSSSAPTRDPQAVTILTQCLQAAGGTQTIAAIQDFTGAGTITFNWANENVSGSVTVKGRGTGQFRLDADLANGKLSWAVNKGDGFYNELDGSTRHIFYSNAVNFGSLTLPYIYIAASLSDPSTSISYVGVNLQESQKAYDVRIQKLFPTNQDPTGILSKLTRKDFFIDTQTFQVLRISDMVHPEKVATIDIPHEMQFSQYQTVNGVVVPFSIAEITDGQHTYTIQLNRLTFNSGLQDSDFEQ